jgi:hypothetical protein
MELVVVQHRDFTGVASEERFFLGRDEIRRGSGADWTIDVADMLSRNAGVARKGS